MPGNIHQSLTSNLTHKNWFTVPSCQVTRTYMFSLKAIYLAQKDIYLCVRKSKYNISFRLPRYSQVASLAHSADTVFLIHSYPVILLPLSLFSSPPISRRLFPFSSSMMVRTHAEVNSNFHSKYEFDWIPQFFAFICILVANSQTGLLYHHFQRRPENHSTHFLSNRLLVIREIIFWIKSESCNFITCT
jgi:hypothetical protein